MAYSIQYGSHIAILCYKLVTPPVELVTDMHNNNKLYTTTSRPALVVTLPLCNNIIEETPLIEIENFTPHPNYA